MPSAVPHWEPTFGPARPAAALVAPALGPLPPRSRGGISIPALLAALLVHGAIPLLILLGTLLGLLDWLWRTHEPERPPIEVALVVEPPPAPPVVEPPKPTPPPPRVPLSSDAQSEGPGKPNPAKQDDEPAPKAPEPGPRAAPPAPKAETPAPQPAPKPATAEPPKPPAPPAPRSTLHAARPQPAPAAPAKPAEPETQTATRAPAPEVAPAPRGEQPPAPAMGKAVYRGFAMATLETPAGLSPALYNAYLAAVRDKIAAQRGLLKSFRFSGGGVRMHLALDRAGRLTDAAVVASTGSRALEHTTAQMVTLAAPFPPPPPEFTGAHILLRFDMILPSSAADWDEFLAGAKPG